MSRSTVERLGFAVAGVLLLIVLASATLIDRSPPKVAATTLNRTGGDDRTALTHAAIDVAFSEPVVPATAQAAFRIDPPVGGSFSWANGSTMVFTPDRKLPLATTFTVRLLAGLSDLAGNVQRNASSPFVFRTVSQPTLTATDPLDGAVDIGLDQPLRLTFDRLMDTQRTAAAIRFDPAMPFTASWRQETLTLTPDGPFQPDTDYQLTIGPAAADTDGNTLAASLAVHFHTLAVGIRISRVLPAEGSAGAPLGGPIAIVFDAPVDPATVAGSISVTPPVTGHATVVALPDDGLSPAAGPGGSPAPSTGATATAGPSASFGGSASPSPPGDARLRVLLFVPAAPLAPNTTYTVQLKAGAVRGAASTAAAAGRSWTFTTGNASGTLQNQIVFRSARGGVTNVWAMNPDGTNAHQVTGDLAPVTSFDVAGDGRTLVFAAGGVVRRLILPAGDSVALTDAGHLDYAPRLIPDGSAVIVGRRDGATGADDGWWLLPLTGGAGPARQLLAAGAPPPGSTALGDEVPGGATGVPGTWAAVGAVAGDAPQALLPAADGQLMLVSLAAGGATVPTGLGAPLGPAGWSARVGGGAFVVAATEVASGRQAVWRIGADGTATAGPATATWTSVAADGALVSVGGQDGAHLAYQGSFDVAPAILITAPDLLDRQPGFGPSGNAIVFVRVDRGRPTVSAGIWSVGPDGSELRQLTLDGADPRWLP